MGGPRGAGGDSEELFGQLDADGNGSVSQDELNALFGQSGSRPSDSSATSSSDQDVYAKLVASLLKQYESSTTAYTTRVGSQLSTAA